MIIFNDTDIQELSIELEKQVRKYLPHTRITLEINEPYWKDPQAKSIICSVLNNQNIKVVDMLTLFPISWNYSEGYVYNVEIQQRVDSEDAIWSQLCHP